MDMDNRTTVQQAQEVNVEESQQVNQEIQGMNAMQRMQQQAVTIYQPAPPVYIYNLALPLPSPTTYYDNYSNPNFPFVLSAIHCFGNRVSWPVAFPEPIGPLPANQYDVLGVGMHDFGYVNYHREKMFTKYMLWFLEINDHLFRSICPSDLNDMPCEWDELQGGCPMLRLCEMKHKYPHPHLGYIPPCNPHYQHQCRYVHDILPTCRSITKQLALPQEEQFHGNQLCAQVGKAEFCDFGHDLESARVESAYEYWQHRAGARAHGSVGFVTRDVWGRKLLRPAKPSDL